MDYVALFFAGAFLCNSIPHASSGLRGKPFPTPFARPAGVGYSRPLVNLLWGFANFIVGLFLLSKFPVTLEFNLRLATVLVGALAMGIQHSLHFGKVVRERSRHKS